MEEKTQTGPPSPPAEEPQDLPVQQGRKAPKVIRGPWVRPERRAPPAFRVQLDRPERPERPARPERPVRPERPERPDRLVRREMLALPAPRANPERGSASQDRPAPPVMSALPAPPVLTAQQVQEDHLAKLAQMVSPEQLDRLVQLVQRGRQQ